MSLEFMREVEAGCRKFGIVSIQGFKAMKLEKITLGRRLPRWLRSKESACNAEVWVQSRVGETPWRRTWQPTPVFLPGEFHEQGNLAG